MKWLWQVTFKKEFWMKGIEIKKDLGPLLF